jgi:hypothetical protein
MIVISHRANIDGANPQRENSPSCVEEVLAMGIDVEIDVWFKDGSYYLGHDSPDYKIETAWLKTNGLWCHAKNQKALEQMRYDGVTNYFWHQEDRFTITSAGQIWCYPNNISHQGILVHLGPPKSSFEVYGVCTDYPISWIKQHKLQYSKYK